MTWSSTHQLMNVWILNTIIILIIQPLLIIKCIFVSHVYTFIHIINLRLSFLLNIMIHGFNNYLYYGPNELKDQEYLSSTSVLLFVWLLDRGYEARIIIANITWILSGNWSTRIQTNWHFSIQNMKPCLILGLKSRLVKMPWDVSEKSIENHFFLKYMIHNYIQWLVFGIPWKNTKLKGRIRPYPLFRE